MGFVLGVGLGIEDIMIKKDLVFGFEEFLVWGKDLGTYIVN